MNQIKPTILLVWSYDRTDALEPFYALSNDFNFHILSKWVKAEEIRSEKILSVHYWIDFKDIQEVIDKIQPMKVIFMSIDRMLSILLKYCANKNSIPTYYLQHGLIYDSTSYKNFTVKYKKRNKLNINKVSLLTKLTFFIKSIGVVPPKLWLRILYYLQVRNKIGSRIYTEWKSLSFLQPDFLIVYTLYNAKLFRSIYTLPEESYLEIGNPTLDKYFSQKLDSIDTDYILLIDTPLLSNDKTDGLGLTIDFVKQFYNKLLDYSRSKSKKLIIKRHPYSFQDPHLIQENNDLKYIDRCSDMELVALIQNADYIFSFNSTLAIPATALNKTCIIRSIDNDFVDSIIELAVSPVIDMQDFNLETINLSRQNNSDAFIERYLYKTDGKSTERLKNILMNPPSYSR